MRALAAPRSRSVGVGRYPHAICYHWIGDSSRSDTCPPTARREQVIPWACPECHERVSHLVRIRHTDSQDDKEVDLYVNDSLCGFEASISMWRDILGGVFFAGNQKNLMKLDKNLPVHILGGGIDPCTNNGKDMEKA